MRGAVKHYGEVILYFFYRLAVLGPAGSFRDGFSLKKVEGRQRTGTITRRSEIATRRAPRKALRREKSITKSPVKGLGCCREIKSHRMQAVKCGWSQSYKVMKLFLSAGK